MIRLIASDLDGTIIDGNGHCDPSVVQTIQKFREKGIRFAVCSGRPISSVLPLLEGWNLDECCDYIVGSNGGEILNVETNKKVVSYTLDADLLKEIIDLYEPQGCVATYYGEDGLLYVQKETPQVISMCKRIQMDYVVADIKELTKTPQIKEMFVIDPSDMEKIETFYQQHLDDRYIGFKTAYDLFEINHPLLAKDVGIRIIATQMGITKDEIMAFGDTTNDVEMLSYVKYGIAMKNGTDDAKSVAYAIAESVDDCGFMKYIEENVLS